MRHDQIMHTFINWHDLLIEAHLWYLVGEKYQYLSTNLYIYILQLCIESYFCAGSYSLVKVIMI